MRHTGHRLIGGTNELPNWNYFATQKWCGEAHIFLQECSISTSKMQLMSSNQSPFCVLFDKTVYMHESIWIKHGQGKVTGSKGSWFEHQCVAIGYFAELPPYISLAQGQGSTSWDARNRQLPMTLIGQIRESSSVRLKSRTSSDWLRAHVGLSRLQLDLSEQLILLPFLNAASIDY